MTLLEIEMIFSFKTRYIFNRYEQFIIYKSSLFFYDEFNEVTMMKDIDISIFPLFDFSREPKPIISFVGAGGKTSLIMAHARYFQQLQKRVLITTTTHMLKDERYFCYNRKEVKQRFGNGNIVMVGKECDHGKITRLDEKELKEYMAMADVVLVEADGAKRRPCKVPRDHEPQILPSSQYVVGVIGMDCLDLTIEQGCFGIDHLCRLIHKTPQEYLNENDLAVILTSKRGTFKDVGHRYYYVVLNKTSSFHKEQQANQVKMMIQDHVDDVVIL